MNNNIEFYCSFFIFYVQTDKNVFLSFSYQNLAFERRNNTNDPFYSFNFQPNDPFYFPNSINETTKTNRRK